MGRFTYIYSIYIYRNIDPIKINYFMSPMDPTVDGRNPANQLRLVVYPIIYRVLNIPVWVRCLEKVTQKYSDPNGGEFNGNESLGKIRFNRNPYDSWLQSLHNWAVYPSSHNHGSGKWVPPILVSFHLGWFSTSMIMGERVVPDIYPKQLFFLAKRLAANSSTANFTPTTEPSPATELQLRQASGKCCLSDFFCSNKCAR